MVQGGEFVLSVQVDRLGKLTDYNPIFTPGYNCGNKIWNKKGSFPLYRSLFTRRKLFCYIYERGKLFTNSRRGNVAQKQAPPKLVGSGDEPGEGKAGKKQPQKNGAYKVPSL